MSRRAYLPFDTQCTALGLPAPVPEYRFDLSRKWRFDWAWPSDIPGGKVALEIEGGAFTSGRHVRGKGYLADCEKYSEAAVLGWRLLRVTPQQIADGSAVMLAQRALKG